MKHTEPESSAKAVQAAPIPSHSLRAGTRALVLGGGGVVGTAWLLGLVAGLRGSGVEPADAELIVGTSAGAIAGTLLARRGNLLELGARAGRPALVTDPAVAANAFAIMRAASDVDRGAARREVGRTALRANTSPAEIRIEQMGELVGTGVWPHDGLLIPTVDAESGIPKVWSITDGVPVHLAVAASTAMPGLSAPIPISGRHYLDGAFREGANTDLAAAANTLVLIEPLGHLFETSAPDGPTTVLRVIPDTASLIAFGDDIQDPARWPAAFDAGTAQASAHSDAVREVWTSVSGAIGEP